MNLIGLSELVRLLLVLVGLSVNLWALHLAWADWQLLRASGRNGALRLVALKAVRGEIIRVLVQVTMLAAAIVSFVDPGEPSDALWWLGATVWVAFLLALWALVDARDRRQLMKAAKLRPLVKRPRGA